MFFLKKALSPLLFPLPIVVLLLGIGVALLWFSRRQKTGKVLATSAWIVLVVASYGWVSDPLLRSLERAHLPPSEAQVAATKWVVVLGGGTSADLSLPIAVRLNGATLARLVEGIRLHRQAPGSKLLLSGAAVFGTGSDAESMSALALALGVAPASIVTDDASQDTESQAENISRIVKGEPVVLVTSANHMPRAFALFRKAGIDALPAPTQFLVQTNVAIGPADFYPHIGGLVTSQIVENEYLGMAWARLRGRM